MAFWNRRNKDKPRSIELTIDPEKLAELERSIRLMTEAVNEADAHMAKSFQDGIKALTQATNELKRVNKPRPKITNH